MNCLHRSKQIIRATHYINSGVKSKLISETTGLSAKTIRSLTKEIHGHFPNPKKQLGIRSILSSKTFSVANILLLRAYQSLDDVMISDVDLDILINVHQYVKNKLRHNNVACGCPSINDFWELVNALQQNKLTLYQCHCGCFNIDASLVDVYLDCPFCQPNPKILSHCS